MATSPLTAALCRVVSPFLFFFSKDVGFFLSLDLADDGVRLFEAGVLHAELVPASGLVSGLGLYPALDRFPRPGSGVLADDLVALPAAAAAPVVAAAEEEQLLGVFQEPPVAGLLRETGVFAVLDFRPARGISGVLKFSGSTFSKSYSDA